MNNTIKLKEHSAIAAIVRLVSKKQKAFVRRQDFVLLDGTAWDEGSRSSYFLINLNTKSVEAMPQSAPVQFGGVVSAPVHLAPGFAIVEAGTFCGRPATPTIYLRTDCLLA